MVFMPRIDLWAMETPQQLIEDTDSVSTNHQCPEKVNSCIKDDRVVKNDNMSSPQSKSTGTEGDKVVTQYASNTWRLFVEQVESICVSTSLMILVCFSLSLLTQIFEQLVRFGQHVYSCCGNYHCYVGKYLNANM